jgi:hypothetical protein
VKSPDLRWQVILVVEDEPLIALDLRAALEAVGATAVSMLETLRMLPSSKASPQRFWTFAPDQPTTD